jgi:hypothetical protein
MRSQHSSRPPRLPEPVDFSAAVEEILERLRLAALANDQAARAAGEAPSPRPAEPAAAALSDGDSRKTCR